MKEKLKRVFNNKTKFFVIVALALIIISLFGGTYAVFQRIDEANAVSTYTTGNLQIAYTDTGTGLGSPINITDAVPKSDTEGAALTPYKFRITNTGNLKYEFDLKLVADATYMATHGCTNNQIAANYIKVKLNNESPVLLSSLTSSILKENVVLNPGESITYELRVWLASGVPNTQIGKHYHGKITTDGNAIETGPLPDTSGANEPELAEGMIPIYYDSNEYVWKKADSSNPTSEHQWYNYSNKLWANAVMVNTNASAETGSKSRQQYMDAIAGTPVLESDILAYYVWIPRYKYKLFNPTFVSATYSSGTCTANCPQEIDVVFETGITPTGTVVCSQDTSGNETCTNKVVGNYYSHPAFTFGSTNLKGIWVGKFETTGDTTTPTIKPNELALRGQKLGVLYTTAQKFGTVTYLTTTGVSQVDFHVMKNIEWGAVAYLKQSQYGLGNAEVYVNNSNGSSCETYTGRSGGLTSAYGITNGTYSYDGRTCLTASCTTEIINAVSLGAGASTTGNITGIYDTNGGGFEHVMGNFQKMDGFSGLTTGSLNIKYYDLYAGSAITYSHLGDALGETFMWYSDMNLFVTENHPWFFRGGTPTSDGTSGSFAYIYNYGLADSCASLRSVLAPM